MKRFLFIIIPIIVVAVAGVLLGIFVFRPDTVEGKYTFNTVNVNWTEDVTNEQKNSILDGRSETLMFSQMQAIWGALLWDYDTSITLNADGSANVEEEGEIGTCTWSLDGENLTLNDLEGMELMESFGNVQMTLSDQSIKMSLVIEATHLKVDAIFAKEVNTPIANDASFVGVYDHVSIDLIWDDSITQTDKDYLINNSGFATETEYFENVKSNLTNKEVINAKVYNDGTFSINLSGNTINSELIKDGSNYSVRLFDVYTLDCNRTENGMEVRMPIYKDILSAKITMSKYVGDGDEEAILYPLQGQYKYSSMVIEWNDGVSTDIKESLIGEDSTEQEYFAGVKSGLEQLYLSNNFGFTFEANGVGKVNMPTTEGEKDVQWTLDDTQVFVAGENIEYTLTQHRDVVYVKVNAESQGAVIAIINFKKVAQ